jgi:hypothetical protein
MFISALIVNVLDIKTVPRKNQLLGRRLELSWFDADRKRKKKKKTRGRKWRHFQNLDWAKTAKIEEKQKIKTLGKRGEKKKESRHFLGASFRDGEV